MHESIQKIFLSLAEHFIRWPALLRSSYSLSYLRLFVVFRRLSFSRFFLSFKDNIECLLCSQPWWESDEQAGQSSVLWLSKREICTTHSARRVGPPGTGLASRITAGLICKLLTLRGEGSSSVSGKGKDLREISYLISCQGMNLVMTYRFDLVPKLKEH